MGVFRWLDRQLTLLSRLLLGKAKIASRDDTAIVVVGMDKSKKYGACPGSGVDAANMTSIFKKYGDPVVLRDSQATPASVLSSLRAACDSRLCIFYYSGHGGRERNKKGVDGWSEFLCLDNGPLHDYDIWEAVSKARGRVVMVFDCCHAETMYRDAGENGETWFKEGEGFTFNLLTKLRSMAGALGDINMLVWSGCPADKFSYGSSEGGMLTNGIRKGVAKSGATYGSVWDSAKHEAAYQKPIRTVLGNGFGGPVFR